MDTATYRDLLRRAHRHSRRADEAEDLLQSALLAALEAGRADLTHEPDRRWIAGVLRYRGLHEARSAARRRQREWACIGPEMTEPGDIPDPRTLVTALPPALRTTALLALTGHTKAEIAWLLRINDAALRQRLSAIRRHWQGAGLRRMPGLGDPRGDLPFGRIRQALLRHRSDPGTVLASHDPDGHLFVVTSQNAHPRQLRRSTINGDQHAR